MSNNKDEKGYFNLTKDLKDTFGERSLKDKALSGAKLIGKLGFNLGKYAVEELPGQIEKTAERNKNKK